MDVFVARLNACTVSLLDKMTAGLSEGAFGMQ